VPYDFIRKRLSILVVQGDRHLIVTKGALENGLAVCASAETPEGTKAHIAARREQIVQRFAEFSSQGFRTRGIACREIGPVSQITNDDESGMTFVGFLVLRPSQAGDCRHDSPP
jgi:P-type Mg2+ transporter